MASQAAQDQVSKILDGTSLRVRLAEQDLVNLSELIATALDQAWQQGFEDAEMKQRLASMLNKGVNP